MAEGYFKDVELGSDALPGDICKTPARMPVIPRVKCPKHPESDRNIEMYCENHNMVYCALCVALEHRTCSSVKQLSDMNLDSHQLNLKELIINVERSFATLGDVKQKKEAELQELETTRSKIQKEIEEFHAKLKQNTDALKVKAVDDLKTKGTKIYQLGKSEISQIDEIMDFLKNCKGQIATCNTLTKMEEFIYHIMISKSLEASKGLRADKNYSGLEFAANRELIAKSMGEISHANKEFSKVTQNAAALRKGIPSVKSISKVRITNEKESHFNLLDMCQLPDGTLFVLDDVNDKVKRLDDKYNIRDTYGVKPLGICCTGSETVVVLSDGGVQKLRIKRSEISDWMREKAQDTISSSGWISFGSAKRIDYVDGFLWIFGNDNNISVVNTTLTQSKVKYKFNLTSCYKIHVHYDHVYIADGVNGVLCVSTDGKELFRLKDQRLVDARGVCTSKKGIVFVSGYQSNNIVLFDMDGNCLGELIAADKGLKNPWSLCYDMKKNRLLVCSHVVDVPVTVIDLAE